MHTPKEVGGNMIINSRKDLDSAPQETREKFMAMLSGTIYSWQWIDGAWKEVQSDREIKRYGFTLEDFPNVIKQPKPDYNPDEQESQRQLEEAIQARQNAYRQESDPINFLWQRGEATKQEWLDAVESIKQRYPKPE